MSEAPTDILFPILVAQLATERLMVESFADRLRALSRDMGAIGTDTSRPSQRLRIMPAKRRR